MNFLSHFYFSQNEKNPYYSLGTILPDLCRNYDKSWKFHPERNADKFNKESTFAALIDGWKLHVQVDKIFHSSPAFALQSSALRNELVSVFTRLPIRPFYLAHVGYELVLDSLLIHHKLIDIDLFYRNLAACDPTIIHDFLGAIGIFDTAGFLHFLKAFIENRYLENYHIPMNLVSALDYIGRGVWQEKFTETEAAKAGIIFQNFQGSLNPHFLEVFNFIDLKLAEFSTIP